MTIEFEIPEVEIASTNEMYMPRPKRAGGGKWTAYVTKTKAMRDFEKAVDPILKREITDDMVSELVEELGDHQRVIRLTMVYYLPVNSFFASDVSNYVKTLEDRIKERLGVDDVRNCEVHLKKLVADYVKTYVRLETYDLEVPLYEDKWPKKVKRGR